MEETNWSSAELSSFTITCAVVNVENIVNCSTSNEFYDSSGANNLEQHRWAIFLSEPVNPRDYDDYPDNLSWEKKLLGTGIFSNNFNGYYYITGCPEKIYQSNQVEVIVSWMIKKLQELGYYTEVLSDESTISITLHK